MTASVRQASSTTSLELFYASKEHAQGPHLEAAGYWASGEGGEGGLVGGIELENGNGQGNGAAGRMRVGTLMDVGWLQHIQYFMRE